MRLPDQIITPEGLHVNAIRLEADTLVIHAESVSPTVRCPVCGRPARRAHSRYTRTLADLPLMNIPVQLIVTVRKFYCDNSLCKRKVFAERLAGTAEALARRTSRQHEALLEIAFALGGEAGARLAGELRLPISPDTLLRYIRNSPEPSDDSPMVLGVDDWAWRRGQRYGTVLVDLLAHRVIDLLLDRSSKTFAEWFRNRPGISVISRDRGGEYAEGARTGAPDAVQVADKFHLVKNLSEATERILKRHSSVLARIQAPGSKMLSPVRLDREAKRQESYNRMVERHKLVHSLGDKGMSALAIARATGLHRHTVESYLRMEYVPKRLRNTRGSGMLEPYYGYILERWQAGYHNGLGLWREVKDMGYPGGRGNVSKLVAHLRRLSETGQQLPEVSERLTARKAVGLLLRRQLAEEEAVAIEALRKACPELECAVGLFEGFFDGPQPAW